ncbi:hypothetical protein BJ741DRAFT_617212 [Chytriomyces cf. hyalinus JEL632]|nr:hypothetical protein BJ741DRAFT_617212 [Chytriomyces cf. hyalinus JEL632]
MRRAVKQIRQYSNGAGGKNREVRYPWLVGNAQGCAGSVRLRTEPSEHSPGKAGLWALLKQRNCEQMGRHAASENMASYSFTNDFPIDATRAALAFADAITLHGLDADSETPFETAMAPSIAATFTNGAQALKGSNLRPVLRFLDVDLLPFDSNLPADSVSSHGALASSPRYAHVKPFKSHITSWHWVYGPCPPPPGYLYQHWLNYYTLVIPQERADDVDYHQLKKLKQHATEEGMFVRIYVSFDARVEFSLVDRTTGIPVYKDVRDRIDLQFTSPHFTPWDEILEPYTPWDGVPVGVFDEPETILLNKSSSAATQHLALPTQKISEAVETSETLSAITSPSSSSLYSTASDNSSNSLAERQEQQPSLPQKRQQMPSVKSMFTPRRREEEWRLKWDWRVCDVDYLLHVPVGHSIKLFGGSKKQP